SGLAALLEDRRQNLADEPCQCFLIRRMPEVAHEQQRIALSARVHISVSPYIDSGPQTFIERRRLAKVRLQKAPVCRRAEVDLIEALDHSAFKPQGAEILVDPFPAQPRAGLA